MSSVARQWGLVGGAHVCGRLGALKDWALAANWRVVASMVDVGFLAGGLVDGVRIVKLRTISASRCRSNAGRCLTRRWRPT